MFSSRFVVMALVQLACWLAAVVLGQPCSAQVRINEILADPGVDWSGDGVVNSKDDEWIEIVNAGAVTVDLGNLRVTDAGTTKVMRYGFSGTLAPGAVQVVYGKDSVAWETANSLSTVGLSLNNTGDTVRLFQIAGADTVLIDSYAYVAFEVLDDRSTARMPDGADTWQLFDGLNPYTGTTPPLGTGCNPTPGNSNHCPTALQPSTWTTVKQLFDLPRSRR